MQNWYELIFFIIPKNQRDNEGRQEDDYYEI